MDKQSAGYPYNKIRDSNKRNKLLILTTIWRKFLNIMLCWRHQTRVYNVSVQSSHSVASDSLRPHGPQHTRLPCPWSTPRVYSNSCPLSGWYHPTISSSVVPFSSCLQSFPASGSFQMSQLFTSGGQHIGVSWVGGTPQRCHRPRGLGTVWAGSGLMRGSRGPLKVFFGLALDLSLCLHTRRLAILAGCPAGANPSPSPARGLPIYSGSAL